MLPSAAHPRSRVLMSEWAIQGDCRAWQASVTVEQGEPSPEGKRFEPWTVETHARALTSFLFQLREPRSMLSSDPSFTECIAI